MNIHGLGAYGIVPFLTDDVLKQARYSDIKTRAGKIAYVASLGQKAGKPEIQDGIQAAHGALKWIADTLKEEEE